MDYSNNFDFQSFKSANGGKKITILNYLHAVCEFNSIPDGFLVCYAKFVYPDFVLLDGLVFLLENYDKDVYDNFLREGMDSREVQYWMNMVEITGIFGRIDVDQAYVLAELIAKIWFDKLNAEFGDKVGAVQVLKDAEQGEVYITIGDFCN